jgi:hypothetical protein
MIDLFLPFLPVFSLGLTQLKLSTHIPSRKGKLVGASPTKPLFPLLLREKGDRGMRADA